MAMFIPCQRCGQQYTEDWTWYVCDKCGYRICMPCHGSHSGPGNGHNTGGDKCSQCQMGWLHLQHGIRSAVENPRPASKLDEYLLRARGGNGSQVNQEPTKMCEYSTYSEQEQYRAKPSNKTPKGVIYTNTALIARKYKNTDAADVRDIILDFMRASENKSGFIWELIDLSSEDMKGAIADDASWMDYAQFLSDYCDGVGICKSARTPLFIIGGSDVIPMPEFYASVGHDVKTIEDSDMLYCFPIDYPWKKVSIDDAIFNVSRLPLDYVERGKLSTSVQDDLGGYFKRAVKVLSDGIPLTYAMMTANAGKNGNNDWTWTSADVMAKLPQQQLKNDGTLTRDNMFLCPALDVMGEEYDSNASVKTYKKHLAKADMLFINLHGSPSVEYSGYLGQESYTPYWGMTIELMKQLKTPIINAFPCYGARYGRYFFDNNDGSMPEYQVYDREDSMLLTAFYDSNVLLFTGSCTSSMCSNVIGNGTIVDHLNESNHPVDLLMPAGYAEAMLKLYACYLFQGEQAGYAMLRAKIDYLNYRAKYENKDLVFLTLNQFNLFGCPILFATPQDATHQLRESFKSMSIPAKELPDVEYHTEFDRFEQGIDGVLNRARTLVDNNLKLLDEKIRTELYGALGLTEDNLTRIESVKYQGQQSYNLTYAKKNKFYPEFYIVQTDENGDVKEVLKSR